MPFNVSRHLRAAAHATPDKVATVLANGESISFAQLDAECDRFAEYFASEGVRPGMRVVVFVKPGLAFVPTIFGCFRLGAIPVCIDPGMKLKHLLACVKEAEPAALVGIRRALWVARMFPKAFASVRHRIAVPRVVPGRYPAVHAAVAVQGDPQMGTNEFATGARATEAHDEAAILFTSGSTGTPKGVVYTHGAFDAQQRLLRSTYGIGEEEIDLVVFPLFALFSAAWGITAVVPRMNAARPARTSGRQLAQVIKRFGVTHTAGSPAIWKNLVAACSRDRIRLPSLKRILMAGAQVPEKLVRACSDLGIDVHTPYGATEALPLTTISHKQLFDSYVRTQGGAGTCVGGPLEGVDIAIIPLIEGPIEAWDESLRRGALIRGEVVVRSAWVTREYFGKPGATQKAKIPSREGLWHRMGDVGYLDTAGQLWFCGRKDHCISSGSTTVCPDPIEAVFDGHPSVQRSAVVGLGPRGSQRAVLVVEGPARSKEWVRELKAFATAFDATKPVESIVFHRRFPVDTRHNIKIDRLKLAAMIEGKER